MTSLSHMINLHKNKAEEKCLKTHNMKTFFKEEEMEVENEIEEEEEDEKLSSLTRKRKKRGQDL